MGEWFQYAAAAAVRYGLHQVFTRLAAERIGEGIGGLVVESTAALTIGIYLVILWSLGKWSQRVTSAGVWASALT